MAEEINENEAELLSAMSVDETPEYKASAGMPLQNGEKHASKEEIVEELTDLIVGDLRKLKR